MKVVSRFSLAIGILISSTCSWSSPRGVAAEASCPSVVWEDEFDGSALDMNHWTPQIGDGCDIDLCGWGNWEEQYYRAENTVVNNGKLVITARPESFGTRSYTSARLRSINKVDIDLATDNHLRVEARIKVAGSQSLWSAFWMMPTADVPWPSGKSRRCLLSLGDDNGSFLHFS